MSRTPGRELLAAVLSTVVALVSAMALYRQPARVVHILTIFAGGFGAGAALPRAIARFRQSRAGITADARDG